MTDSPFLPGTHIQYAWDSTSIGLLKTCPRLYQYTIIDGYQPKGESVHLRFGGEFHQALWNYDKMIAEDIPHEEALREAVHAMMITTADWRPVPDPSNARDPRKYKNRESLIRTVIYYLDHRRNDPLKTYRLANGDAAVEVSFRFELAFGPEAGVERKDLEIRDATTGEYLDTARKGVGVAAQPYLLCGHLDRVCEDSNGDLFIEDHKTTTSTPGQYYFAGYEPNNQMSLYTTAGQVVLEAPVRGVAINAVQLLLEPPYARFVRGFTFRNAEQLDEWQTDLARWLQLAEWYAENEYWPQNDTACDKFGGCRFRDVCSKAPSVRHIYLKSDFTQLAEDERWNPLKPR
jgi:hypothetical protein